MSPHEPTLDPITNRSEVVFLFDATDANPNGDPLTEENRPRVDEANQQALVSDVRLKRTVRDYLDRHGYPIFIKAAGEEEGRRDDKNDRFAAIEPLMEEYLGGDLSDFDLDERERAFLAVANDVRLFGDSMAFDTANDTDYLTSSYTGPFQFGFARSLNKVEVDHHGKTSVLSASSEEQQNIGGNMYTEHRLPYALFAAHAVINEHAASDVLLSEDDISLALEALWNGTNELNSSSKFGHQSRLLLRIAYSEDTSHIGDAHRHLDLKHDLEDSADIRDIEEASIVIDSLIESIERYSDRIDTVSGQIARRIQIQEDGEVGGPERFVSAVERVLDGEKVALTVE